MSYHITLTVLKAAYGGEMDFSMRKCSPSSYLHEQSCLTGMKVIQYGQSHSNPIQQTARL